MLSLHNKTILITGCAGFIGFHVTSKLLHEGAYVIGIDNLNNYYDVTLKNSRLEILKKYNKFLFLKLDLIEHKSIINLGIQYPDIQYIIHLAAQAGVRYSLINPFAYTGNVTGHLSILELARNLKYLEHLVYASSSSVYGANIKLPFSIHDKVDTPISLYAATKKSCELMSHSYNHLFKIPITGLRFFTVYGSWGRPDMAAFIFTKAILAGDELPVYNHGDMRRNFTYIDDVVDGTISCLLSINNESNPRHELYNIGNNCAERLMDFINVLEKQLGRKANIKLQPLQPGDVKETIADISESTKRFGFKPKVNIEEGLQNFVLWYKDFY